MSQNNILNKNFDSKGFFYVLLQFVLFILYVFPMLKLDFFCFEEWQFEFLFFVILGMFLIIGAIMQLRHQLTPFPKPVKEGALLTTGFFNFSRHPIYSGILIVLFFYALYSCSGWRLTITLVFLILFYFKSSYEESLLMKKFPEYKKYQNRVGRFCPKIIR